MKKRFFPFLLLWMLFMAAGLGVVGQTIPQTFNYQAVVRDTGGNLAPNASVVMRFFITRGAPYPGGTLYFEASKQTTANAKSLVNHQIGSQDSVLNDISDVPWDSGGTYLTVHMGVNGAFPTLFASAPFAAMPYAFLAQEAEHAAVADSCANCAGGTQQVLQLIGDSLFITPGNGVDLSRFKITSQTLQGANLVTIEGGDTTTTDLSSLVPTGASVWTQSGNQLYVTDTTLKNIGIGTANPKGLEAKVTRAWIGPGQGQDGLAIGVDSSKKAARVGFFDPVTAAANLGIGSVVVGNGIADTTGAVAIGDGAKANAVEGTAIGTGATVDAGADYGVAQGYQTLVQGAGGVAIGQNAQVYPTGTKGIGIGDGSKVSGSNGVAIGQNAHAAGTGSKVFVDGYFGGVAHCLFTGTNPGTISGNVTAFDTADASWVHGIGVPGGAAKVGLLLEKNGNFGIGNANPSVRLAVGFGAADPNKNVIAGSYLNWCGRELKYDIAPLGDQTSLTQRFMALEPVSFRYKGDPSKRLYYNFIAQDVKPLFPHAVQTVADETGEEHPVLAPMEFIGVLTQVTQDQQRTIEALEAVNAEKDAEIAELKANQAQILERLEQLEKNQKGGSDVQR